MKIVEINKRKNNNHNKKLDKLFNGTLRCSCGCRFEFNPDDCYESITHHSASGFMYRGTGSFRGSYNTNDFYVDCPMCAKSYKLKDLVSTKTRNIIYFIIGLCCLTGLAGIIWLTIWVSKI